MEAEVVKTKQKMGEIMNLVIENGKVELVDKIYSIANA